MTSLLLLPPLLSPPSLLQTTLASHLDKRNAEVKDKNKEIYHAVFKRTAARTMPFRI